MDIQKIISDLVAKLTGNKDLIASFTKDPVKAIKDLLGIDIGSDQVSEVVKGVTSQLGDLTGDVAKEGSGILQKIMGFFSAAIGTVYAWFNNFSVYTDLKEKGYDVDFMDAVNNNFLSEGEPVC